MTLHAGRKYVLVAWCDGTARWLPVEDVPPEYVPMVNGRHTRTERVLNGFSGYRIRGRAPFQLPEVQPSIAGSRVLRALVARVEALPDLLRGGKDGQGL